MVKIVKRLISERCIGYTKEGYSIYRCEVECTDGTTDTLYRTVEHAGRIYGLAETHPPLVTTNEQTTLDFTICSDCGKSSPSGLFYVGEQQLCGACAYKHA